MTVWPVPTFASTLRALQEETGINNSELARRLGYADGARRILRWRSGEVEPRWGTVPKIADALGVPLERFLVATDQEDEGASATAPPVDSGALDVLVERRRHPRVAGGQAGS